eukprot:COSAG02_NODE_4441_length_5354_cov_3.167650_2_plen_75_part_00
MYVEYRTGLPEIERAWCSRNHWSLFVLRACVSLRAAYRTVNSCALGTIVHVLIERIKTLSNMQPKLQRIPTPGL